MEEVEYRVRSRKEGADTYVVHEVPKGAMEFTVVDLQAATTYNFSILAQSSKGMSAYTTDIVQYKTAEAPVVAAAPASPDAPAPPEGGGKEGGGLVGGIGAAAAALLLCNLALLACYLRRRKGAEEEESSGGTSSILEMYLSTVSSGYGVDEDSEVGDSEDSEDSGDLEDWRPARRRERHTEDAWPHHPRPPPSMSVRPPPSISARPPPSMFMRPPVAPYYPGLDRSRRGLPPRLPQPWSHY